MLGTLNAGLRATVRFRSYEPQRVTLPAFMRWLRQFQRNDRRVLCDLVRSVRFVTDADLRRYLLNQYEALCSRLTKAGIPLSRTIFLSIDDAGSSSGVALNKLRNAARLSTTQAIILDSRNAQGIQERVLEFALDGRPFAVVYVDDFVGSGKQFEESRDYVAQFYLGRYSEYLLAAVICEEAIHRLGGMTVSPLAGFVHSRSERPLLDGSSEMSRHDRDQLIELANRTFGHPGLGFCEMATMVVMHDNAPDSTPALITGDYFRKPAIRGLLPRVQDLPAA